MCTYSYSVYILTLTRHNSANTWFLEPIIRQGTLYLATLRFVLSEDGHFLFGNFVVIHQFPVDSCLQSETVFNLVNILI